jgi:hypothetical protein
LTLHRFLCFYKRTIRKLVLISSSAGNEGQGP